MKKIVVIGGGTGTYTVLSGLKKYDNVELTAVVSMADSGGSNRILRDDFGLLPTSDIRQCLVALSDNNGEQVLWRKLFTYRYNKGVGIAGMTFGNLFMAALTDILGSQAKAIEKTGQILKIKGKVIPVSFDDVQLMATYENGAQVVGEHFIDEPKKEHDGKCRIKKLVTVPKAKANPEALKAISEADYIILGPGDLYTSVLANLAIGGISKAICESKAKVIYVMNLMTKYGQTYGMSASEHISEMEKYINQELRIKNSLQDKHEAKKRINYIILNNGVITDGVLKKYEKEMACPVVDDLKEEDGYKVIRENLIPSAAIKKVSGDILKRSFIRHDAVKLAKVIGEQ